MKFNQSPLMQTGRKFIIAASIASALSACGGGSSTTAAPPLVAATNISVAITSQNAGILVPTPSQQAHFMNGFSAVDGNNNPLSLSFTDISFTGTPANARFRMESTGSTAAYAPAFAEGSVKFGPCIFTIDTSTADVTKFPNHPLAIGKSIKVDPCTETVLVKDLPAGTAFAGVTLTFGTSLTDASPRPAIVTLGTDGSVTINGVNIGTVAMVPKGTTPAP